MAQNTTELERVRYWQGQLLASEDLKTQLRVSDEMRRLHNRAVHEAYGIAIGLELERDEATAEIKLDEDGNLTLICGMAYDCAGRELILQSNRAIPFPPQFPMTLVIARDNDAVDGIALRWKALREINPNTEIAITTFTAGPPKPTTDPEFRPVVARPIARPRMATGQTIPGETTWQTWKIGETKVGVKVAIDTSAAGFTQQPRSAAGFTPQPHYFAEVIPGNPTADFIPAWFASVADPSPEGFTFQLLMHRITRQRLEIVDPKAQIAQPPALSPNVTLDAGGLFVIGDIVSRVLPLAENAAVIKTLTGDTVVLESPLADFSGTKLVALGNVRREAVVTKLSDSASFFEATVDRPELFAKDDVVVKLNGQLENTRPSRVVSTDEAGTLELLPAITGLVEGDTLAVVKPASVVSNIAETGTEITVEDPSLYAKDNVVARLTGPIETSPPVKIVKKKADGTLVLSKPITGLKKGNLLGVAGDSSQVTDVNNNESAIKIEVDNVAPFFKKDLVAKSHENGDFSAPVRVGLISKNTKTITLSGSISGLAEGDTIVACNFEARATVVKTKDGKTLQVHNVALFPQHSYVAKVDDLLSASLPAQVNSSSGALLTLDSAIAGIKPGDVIGLCYFPRAVRVNAISNDGAIQVSADGLLREGDLVTALPAATKTGVSLVTKIIGNVIRLANPLPLLAVGDRLSVVSIRGAVKAKHTGVNKVEVDQPARLRVGDFLADITGWRQVQDSTAVEAVVGNQITMTATLDGSLLNDIVGLASINSNPGFFFFQVRLDQLLQLSVRDEVRMIGFDRLRGELQTASAVVAQIIPQTKVVILEIQDAGAFTLRPEDISASVPFLRGDPMTLIQKHDLFVSWLAVGDPEQMPRRCDGKDEADCECSQAKE